MLSPTPLEQLLEVVAEKRSLTLGVPASTSDVDQRFPLTPEGAAMLVSRGIDVRMERGAGTGIHYSDQAYTRAGAHIVSRGEALLCDIVLHLPPVSSIDARGLRRGALLLTLFHPNAQDANALRILLDRHVIALALDLIADTAGNRPFADILDEIDGRAAMSIASSLLADSIHGKGILLGGVPGVVPSELTVIGAGLAGISAAKSAIGLGAMVRIFDTDVYRLRRAARELGPAPVLSAMHPRVLVSALRTADVVVASPLDVPHIITPEVVSEMKRGVVTFCLGDNPRPIFPTMRCLNLAHERPSGDIVTEGRHICYVNATGAVPRTVAMALSNTMTSLFTDIMQCGGTLNNALKLHPGMQRAAYIFSGNVVNPRIAAILGVRPIDINMLLQFS
ncbi:MAG: hypothetical protein ACI30O_09215 [Muribaculaceae bacterium]